MDRSADPLSDRTNFLERKTRQTRMQMLRDAMSERTNEIRFDARPRKKCRVETRIVET